MSNVIESLNSWFHASQQGCLSCETCGECPDEDYKKWIALLEFLSLSSSFCRFELPAQSVSLSSRRSLLLLSAFPGKVARPVRSHAQLQSSLILDRANGATTCVLQRMLPGEECRFSPARGAREVITVCDVGPIFWLFLGPMKTAKLDRENSYRISLCTVGGLDSMRNRFGKW